MRNVLYFFIVCLIAASSHAGELKLKTKTCAIFKNGLALFVADGEAGVEKDAQTVWLNEVPQPSHGSLWVLTYDKETKVDEVVALREDLKRDALTLAEMFQANVGKKVKIQWGEKEISGTIQSVPVPEKKTTSAVYQGSYSQPYQDAPNLVNILTDTGLVSLSIHSISTAEFSTDYNKTLTVPLGAKKLKIKVSTAKDIVKLGMSYLQKGITWAPSYLIDISDAKKAKIIMSATVANDVQDVENADMYFVVGYPHFMFQDVLSPLASDADVGAFINALTNRTTMPYAGPTSNMTAQSMGYTESLPEPDVSYSASSAGNLGGEAAEDLFFYEMKNVTLKKGERAYYTVFTDNVDYKHIYEWDIPETAISSYNSSQSSGAQDEVWHSLKLINASAVPWTTAPAMTVLNFKALGQDVLNYTPKSAKSNVKITVAPDIKVKRVENEKERKNNALNQYGYSYDLVTVEGKLTLKNFKNQSVTMDITKKISGVIVSATDGGKTEKLAEALKSLNPSSRITWEIPLKAGEEKNIAYSYKIYIRT